VSGAPWRVAVVWMTGHGDDADAVRTGLEGLGLPTVVVADDAGNLGVAAGLAGHLDGEAGLDLEEQLERLGLDMLADTGSSVESGEQPSRPSAGTLFEELVASAQHPMTQAFPRCCSTPDGSSRRATGACWSTRSGSSYRSTISARARRCGRASFAVMGGVHRRLRVRLRRRARPQPARAARL